MSRNNPSRKRIMVETDSGRYRAPGRAYAPGPSTPERWIAVSIIAAAVLATFVALFITSRPFDPMTSSFDAQQAVPQGPLASPSQPKGSPSPTPTGTPNPGATVEAAEPAAEPVQPPDDAAIQAKIEKSLTSDPVLGQLDVSTIVENGRVTIVGSVHSNELKQRIARMVSSLKGVLAVDNQLVVIEPTP
jgi:hypothetical protein